MARLLPRSLRGQLLVQRGVAAADALDPPLEDVADRRLSGLDAEVSGQNRAFDDAANARNVGDAFVRRHDGAIAGRCSDHFDQRAFADPAADRAVVYVEFADRDGDALWKAKPFRPFRAKRASRLGCVIGLFIETVAQIRETGIERAQELLVRKAAPVVGVERLVTGGADAAFDAPGIDDAGKDGRRPVGELNPRIGGLKCLRRDVEAMPDFGPEPFGRIDPAAFGDELRADLGAKLGDPGGFAPARVVLPEPALSVEIAFPVLGKGKGTVRRVDGDRA